MPIQSVPLATMDDIAAAYELAIPPESEDRVQWLLDYASARLLRLRPLLMTDVAAGRVSPILVTGALVTAVLRVLRNPGAYRSETAGEFAYTLNTAVASGLLTFSQEEMDDCSPLPGRVPAGVGSIRLGWPGPGGPGCSGDVTW